MINRRQFTLAAAAVWAGTSRVNVLAAGTPTQDALIMDAMGEIREVYTDSLCREMIDAGMNSVTVTLCDPKSFEAEAYAWAIAGVLEYDRLINKESEFWMKATSVADIQTAREQGKIVIIASHGGRKPRGIGDKGRGTAQQPYLVSKAAAIQFTHLLAIELGPFNINVNAVCPGRLWTPMWEAIAINHKELNPDYAEMTPHEIFLDQVKATMPLGRPQTPEEIGKTVAFLASDESSEITGQAINVNGGAIMN